MKNILSQCHNQSYKIVHLIYNIHFFSLPSNTVYINTDYNSLYSNSLYSKRVDYYNTDYHNIYFKSRLLIKCKLSRRSICSKYRPS